MNTPDASKICFGLSEEIDRESFALFLQLAGRKEFAPLLARRCSSKEIIAAVDQLMALLRNHLNEQEYHALFLCDANHHHPTEE